MPKRNVSVLSTLVLLVLLFLSVWGRGVGAVRAITGPSPVSDSPYLFGTLLTDPTHASKEYDAGIRIAHLELGWNLYEPSEGDFDRAYIEQMRQELDAFAASGLRVVLGVGLQYPPTWAYEYPNSRYVDQFGIAADPLNLTFNQTLRNRAATYIARVNQDLDLNRFWAVRVGSGGLVEALYPDDSRRGWEASYWAFDEAAQGRAPLPNSIPPAPYPGWHPGQLTYDGHAFSPAQADVWMDWYLGALIDGMNWQLDTYRNEGFTGYQQVLLPGVGTKPAEYDRAIASRLSGGTSRTLGRGAAWDHIIAGLRPERNVVVYVSSMADGSGKNDECQDGDSALELVEPQIESWSATRWIVYNARRAGLPTMGENPGRNDIPAVYGPALLDAATRQMEACGMLGLMWAHSDDLYSGTAGLTLVDLASTIRRFNR